MPDPMRERKRFPMNQEAWITAVSSVALFVVLSIPGVIFTRKNLLTSAQTSGLSTVVVDFLWPVMVIDVMVQVHVSRELIQTSLKAGAYMILGVLFCGALGLIYLKLRRIPRVPGGILLYGMALSNTGIIGMPLIKTLWGSEALFVSSIAELANDVMIFTVGMLAIQAGCGKNGKMNLRGMISPGFISVIVGFLLFLSGIQFPKFVLNALDTVTAAMMPIGMFLMGAQLGECNFKSLLRERRLYEVAAMRLLILPLAVYGVLFGILHDTSLVSRVIMLMMAMPSPTTCAIFARQYQGDYGLATRAVMLNTVLSALTLPIWIFLTN